MKLFCYLKIYIKKKYPQAKLRVGQLSIEVKMTRDNYISMGNLNM